MLQPRRAPAGRPPVDDGGEMGAERALVDEGEIGAGGSGTVRQAYDPILRRVVALKVMAPGTRNTAARRNRFIDEARTMAQLDHPNIVPVHDLVAGERKATYFVMKLVRGRTLTTVVEERMAQAPNPEGLHRLLLTFLKVCDAVAFAHSRGVIHCDLKPDNIMVGQFGEVYLMDWGIAQRKAQAGDGARTIAPEQSPGKRPVIRGTPAFMAPEQAHGAAEALGERTDVFGLGAVLYFILTGRPPFDGKTATQCIARAKDCAYDEPTLVAPKLAMPPSLIRIVKIAMARDPADRYATAFDVIRDIEAFTRGDWLLPVKTFAPGSVIVKEGDFADAAYIVVSGTCRVFKGSARTPIRTLGPGDVFGETGILSGDVRTATVEASDEVVARVVTRELFQSQLGVDSWLAKFVLALADRFRDLDQRLRKNSG